MSTSLSKVNPQGPVWQHAQAMKTSVVPSSTVQVITQAGVHTAAEYQAIIRLFRLALAAQLYRAEPTTKTSALDTAAKFNQMWTTLIHFVAKNPAIAGVTGGITLMNASFLSSKVKAMLLDCDPNSVAGTEIGWQATALSTVTWANVVSAAANVSDQDGRITLSALAMAVGYKCQYYPSTVIDMLGGIQNSYNTVTLPDTARQLLANTLGKKDPKILATNSMNSYLGHCQGSVSILAKMAMEMDPSEYRRDNRPVYDRSKQVLETPRHVIPNSTHGMRAVLTSALEMSIATGDVERKTIASATGNAPKSTSYVIKRDTPFAAIIELAIETKRYYNSAGVKDLGQYHASDPSADIYTEAPMWKSLTTDMNGNYVFSTASLILEIETRLRISDWNNNEVVKDPLTDKAPARTDSKKVKPPNYTYFMKNPRELTDAESLASKCTSYEMFRDQAGLRQDTERRMKKMYDDAGSFTGFLQSLNVLARRVESTCVSIALIHLDRTISNSLAKASAGAARVMKPFRQ